MKIDLGGGDKRGGSTYCNIASPPASGAKQIIISLTLPHHGRGGIVVGQGRGQGGGKRVALMRDIDDEVTRTNYKNADARTEGQAAPQPGAGARLPR